MSSVRAVLLVAMTTAIPLNLFAAEKLGLDEYMQQVRGGNQGYQGALKSAEGSESRALEAEIRLAPTAFAGWQFTNDESPRVQPAFLGNKSVTSTYSLGLSQQTRFGLGASLSYNLTSTEILGANPAFLNPSDYKTARTQLELTFPLWRNLFGKETRAGLEMLEAQAMASSYTDRYNAKVWIMQAELAYLRLALARDVLEVQKNSLERSEKIRDYNANQARLGLGDNSDRLQAEAALRLRALEYRAAQDEMRSASLAFNSARGLDADVVEEATLHIPELVKQLKDIDVQAPEDREDVKAALQNERATEANSRVALQRLSPVVDTFFTGSLGGLSTETDVVNKQALSLNYPAYTVGVRVSAPLDVPKIFKTRSGYRKAIQGAEDTYERRSFDSKVEYDDLMKKISEARARADLSRQIEDVQKSKLDYERARRARGKTTTYFVLLFEQDYAAAQMVRLRSEVEVMNLLAQMRRFAAQGVL